MIRMRNILRSFLIISSLSVAITNSSNTLRETHLCKAKSHYQKLLRKSKRTLLKMNGII
jgi:hypothetical protein